MDRSINTTNSNKTMGFTGLNSETVKVQRALHGSNRLYKQKNLLISNIREVVFEPMFILLFIASIVYFFLEEYTEGFSMVTALFLVSGIAIYQSFRSQRAVKALSKITKTKAMVIRNSEVIEIESEELVTEDVIICEEGTIIPADAIILTSYDFSVNEAVLTGESVSVEKFENELIMQGTQVVRGYCYAKVTAVGKKTTLSGIGELISNAENQKTPLQIKVAKFVRVMVIIGGIAFAFVWFYNWWESGSVIHGLLHGLTMAMSILPEEIPVAFSTFMALGAYHLLKFGVIARTPMTVETLGSASVICLDKTGTLTQNLMHVAKTFSIVKKEEIDFKNSPKKSEVLEYAMWSSEVSPFDPMEKSIHSYYSDLFTEDKRKEYEMVKEFPLSGKPPVMTHIYQNSKKEYILACKGGLEGVLKLCHISDENKKLILEKGKEYAKNGFRVLGVAKGKWTKDEQPETQDEITFEFLGIITFSDPPDPKIAKVIEEFYDAGVEVKMITGDYLETAVAIAEKTGIKSDNVISGDEIERLSAKDLESIVKTTHIFARVNPETKLRIVNALKASGEVVAMTGDGVNDAPALTVAHIGIAMGKRGTEVAKGAAGLILSNDDLSKMIDAIYLGRKINENLVKAIRYIISIHIPIILLVVLPIFIGWLPSMLFQPIHVIFFELIMGFTCSIAYENEPIPREFLKKATQASGKNLLNNKQLGTTILQGLLITIACVISGYIGVLSGFDETKIRTYVFCTLILANIFLTFINRSFTSTLLKTIKRKNNLIPIIIVLSILLLIAIIHIPYLSKVFIVSELQLHEYLLPIILALVFTVWIEPIKYFKNK